VNRQHAGRGIHVNIRRGCAVVAALSAVFAAYISLVPFDLHLLSVIDARDALIRALDFQGLSRSNFIANVVLFVPFGFFAAGALDRRRGSPVRDIAILAVALLVSVSIEALQVFVPGRTPSILDVIAQGAGTVLGLIGWRLIRDEAGRWLSDIGHGTGTPMVERVLVAYVVCRTVALLLPLDVTVSLSLLAEKYRSGGIRLVPFSGASDFATIVQSFSIDMILAAPIGALAVRAATRPGERRSLAASIGLSTLFIACVELSQVIVMSRVADTTQIISGSLGAAIGAMAMIHVVSVPSRTRRRGAAPAAPALIALAVSAGAYVAYNWSPFDFTASGALIRERLVLLGQVPFYGYYQNPELKAATDFLTKILVAMPIGISAACVFTADRMRTYPKAGWFLVSVIAAMFFTVIEVGQVLLPQRYPDLTDVIIAMLGFGLGALLARLSVKHAHSLSAQLPQ
jgi:glycopeptide antibiotics resistance protein